MRGLALRTDLNVWRSVPRCPRLLFLAAACGAQSTAASAGETASEAALLFPLLKHRAASHSATAYRGAQFSIDPQSHLLQVERRRETRAAGLEELATHYGDYRRVGNVRLTHRIETAGPELGARMRIKRHALNPRLPVGFFSNPEAHRFLAPYELRIATTPQRLYKEADGLSDASWQRLWGIV